MTNCVTKHTIPFNFSRSLIERAIFPERDSGFFCDEDYKNMLKTIQIQANNRFGDLTINNLLKSAGVKRIHSGWYSLWYDGMIPNYYNVVKAKRNVGGKIKQYKSKKKNISTSPSQKVNSFLRYY